MLHEINRTAVEMKMKEMRKYAIHTNLATKARKNRKKTESERTSHLIPFLRSKKVG